jgi:hypothetical protein
MIPAEALGRSPGLEELTSLGDVPPALNGLISLCADSQARQLRRQGAEAL